MCENGTPLCSERRRPALFKKDMKKATTNEERIKKALRILCVVTLILWSAGCSGPASKTAPESGTAEAEKSPVSAASKQCTIRYAKGFAVSYHNGCKVVTVFEPGSFRERRKMSSFILVPRGARPQTTMEGALIEVPVRRVALRSASHAPFFSMLGVADRIVAITQGKFVNDPEVAELIRQGRIAEVGVGSGMSAQFNVEKLITLRPDLVMSWWTNNPAFAGHIKAQEAGLTVALLADYEENTPLGRTEWIKFVALFFDAEAEAERVFNDIERRYLAMAEKTKNVQRRPTVMYGNSYQGSWYIAGGNSLFANLVKDAGGEYIWSEDNATGSRPVNTETAVIRGRNADYWLTQNQNHISLASLTAEDTRYRLFKAFQTRRVYSNNGKVGPGGGNDYYQGAAARPDILLADMTAILHPELLPRHQLVWHVHLPATIVNSAAHGKEQSE